MTDTSQTLMNGMKLAKLPAGVLCVGCCQPPPASGAVRLVPPPFSSSGGAAKEKSPFEAVAVASPSQRHQELLSVVFDAWSLRPATACCCRCCCLFVVINPLLVVVWVTRLDWTQTQWMCHSTYSRPLPHNTEGETERKTHTKNTQNTLVRKGEDGGENYWLGPVWISHGGQ